MIAIAKWLLLLALTVPLAFLGWLLARDPGRLSVHAWGWQIDTTLVLALLLLAVTLGVLWLAYWLIWQLPNRLIKRRQHNLALQFRHGLEDLAQGRYAKARRRLLAASALKDHAPLALLHAAESAFHLGEHADALALLARAQRCPEVSTAAEVLAIKIQLLDGDISKLERLQALADSAEHPLPALTLAQTLGARGRAREAMTVLAKLGKNAGGGTALDWAAMVRLALRQASTTEALAETWGQLSQREREQPDVLANYCAASLRLHDVPTADAALLGAIKRQPCETLWQSYSDCCAKMSPEALPAANRFVEGQLKKSLDDAKAGRSLAEADSAAGLLAAAILARRMAQHTAAASYLSRSLQLEVSPGALREQGELRLASGDFSGAIDAWRKLLDGA